ncbi:MAG: DUF2326 domain-containing protein [Verrucomicrobia bacterium]|nr:DUF2326 domain-containing protein [Verrucomicrobiota bacterium]
MKLRLHRLSSEPKFFEPIAFGSGVNLILGEIWDEDQPQGKKVNGVGKSLCVEFIHFGLLRDFEQTRVAKIPKDKLPDGLTVVLDLSIHGQPLQIRRKPEHPNEPTIVRNGQSVTFGNLDEATRYLGDLLFADSEPNGFVSFRSLMSLLMRDETSGFSDILKTMPAAKSVPGDRLPHLYLLGLDVAQNRRLLQTIKEIDTQTKVLAQLKVDLTKHGELRIGDIAAELNQEQKDVERIEQGLADLRAEPAFAQVEKELNGLEIRLGELRARRKGVSFQVDQIRSLPQPEVIDETDIAIIYNRVRAGLGELVTKSLEQAKAFKAEIDTFQRSLLSDELATLEREQRELTERIRALSTEHSALVARVDRKGTLKELRTGLHVAVHKQQDYYRRTALYEQYREAEQCKEDLKSERQQALDALRKQIHDHKEIETSMNHEVAEIHERIMGIRNASFTLHVNSGANVKHPLDFDLRIADDGSQSVNRTKVFIYDCALMFATCTQGRHPRFLLHDNIFDVDQDTLVQCLNFLQERIDDGEDFQYILTLNREKIEVEERANQIRLSVNEARKAKLTKAASFLGFRYQEIHRRGRDHE